MTADSIKNLAKQILRADYLALLIQCALLGIGVAFIYGAGLEIGGEFASKWYKQLMWIGLGFICYVTTALIDYRLIAKYSWVFYIFGLLALLSVFTPLGATLNNSRSWLKLPGIGFFQPSEIAKPATLLFMSWVATRHALRYSYIPLPVPILLSLCLPFFFVCLQPDFGTALVFLPLTAAIIFITGIKWRWIVLCVSVGILAVPALYMVLKPHQKERLKVFLEPPVRGMLVLVSTHLSEAQCEKWTKKTDDFFRPEKDKVRDNWNAKQSLLAVGSGGLTGKGYLQGTQHVLGYLPKKVAPTDFIFSVIAEETGFIGGSIVIGLIACLLLCYCRTALLAGRALGSCVAIGAAVILATHTIINVGMTVQAVPIIGLPLPFISYGGSFMLGTMFLAGLVQNIHIHRRQIFESRSRETEEREDD